MALSDSAGLLFKIRADGSQAKRELSEVQGQVAGMAGKAGPALASLAGPAAIAAAGVAAIATAAVAVTSKLFDLSKQAAEYASSIKDAADKTGASTDSLQALRIAAEQSGSSFESITGAVSKLNVLIGQAAAGNEKAAATLKAYGITAKDTDAALVQAISTIANMKNSTDQAAASQALFRDRTGEILPVIKSFDGNLPALIDKLRKLGVIIGEDAVNAGDEFGDQMDLLNKQLSIVGHTIGFAVMPVFLKFATNLSQWLSTNQGEIRKWAQVVGDMFALAAQAMVRVYDDARRLLGILEAIAALATQGQFGLGAAYSAIKAVEDQIAADQEARKNPVVGDALPGGQGTGGAPIFDATPEKIKKTNIDRVDSQKEVNDALLKAYKDRLQREYELWLETEQTKVAKLKAFVAEGKATEDALFKFQREVGANDFAARLKLLEKERAKRKELGMNTVEIDNKINLLRLQAQQEIYRRAEEDAQKKFEDDKERIEALAALEKQLFLEALERREGIFGEDGEPRITVPKPEPEDIGLNDTGLFDGWTDSWNTFADAIDERVGDVESSLTTMADALQDAFEGVANALGSVVQQWVLYGDTGPAVMRKVLASALASIAAEAAVNAIYATALGFIRLAQYDFVAAGNAFTSAAMWAAVAGGAALAGRAVAGDSFKKQSQTATGRSGGTTTGSRSSNEQGQAYSSHGDKPYVHEEGRNQPLALRSEVTINVIDKSGGFGKLFELEVQRNGRVRKVLLNNGGSS